MAYNPSFHCTDFITVPEVDECYPPYEIDNCLKRFLQFNTGDTWDHNCPCWNNNYTIPDDLEFPDYRNFGIDTFLCDKNTLPSGYVNTFVITDPNFGIISP